MSRFKNAVKKIRVRIRKNLTTNLSSSSMSPEHSSGGGGGSCFKGNNNDGDKSPESLIISEKEPIFV